MNKVILVGRLASDPELKKAKNGTSVLSFSVAVKRRFPDSDENYKTDFINCVAWQKTAEFICNYFAKGQMIGLVGSVQPRKWTDGENKTRYATDIIIEETYFTENKKNESMQSKSSDGDFMPGYSSEDTPF